MLDIISVIWEKYWLSGGGICPIWGGAFILVLLYYNIDKNLKLPQNIENKSEITLKIIYNIDGKMPKSTEKGQTTKNYLLQNSICIMHKPPQIEFIDTFPKHNYEFFYTHFFYFCGHLIRNFYRAQNLVSRT